MIFKKNEVEKSKTITINKQFAFFPVKLYKTKDTLWLEDYFSLRSTELFSDEVSEYAFALNDTFELKKLAELYLGDVYEYSENSVKIEDIDFL